MTRRFRTLTLCALLTFAGIGSGCMAKKVVALPLRVTGAALTVVPVVGGAAHGVLDSAAEVID